HPQLSVSAAYDPKRSAATVTLEQKQPIDDGNPAFAFDVDLAFAPDLSASAQRSIRVRVERAKETVTVPLDFEPKLVRFDPGAYLLADVSYSLGVDYAAAALSADPSPVAR